MRAILLGGVVVTLLAACEAPQPAQGLSARAVEDARLSAQGPSREIADEACRAEATALDTVLNRRGTGTPVAEAFDKVANCRHAAAEAIILAHANGSIPRARAAADLIGLRGAMRRDVARLETAIFRSGTGGDLRARAMSARDRQDRLTLRDS